MSNDNIDYAELDKAVNEAMQVQPVEPATRPVARPVVHTAAPRPVLRPATPKITTAPQPAIVPRSAKVGTAATKPVRPSVSAQIQHKQQIAAAKPVAKPAAKPVAKPVEKPVAKPAVKAEEKPVSKPVERSKKVEKAPNANNYSLGVRSPFMTNTKVEKRPLGKDIPETSVSNLHSTKNIYSSKSPSKVTGKPAKKKHMVTEAPKKHSGWLWTLLVLFVIGAGAGLGYLAYILVFAK